MEWKKCSEQPTGKPDNSTVTSSKVKKKPKSKNQANEKNEEREIRSLLSSMRRLKIQEKLLETAAENCIDNQQLKSNIQANNAKRLKESSELKESLQTVEALFDRFKSNISSPECIKKMDIEDYKKMVKELDDKFLSFKKYLNKETYSLKHTEINLLSELKQVEEELTVANTKTAVKPYTSVVPSPVKAIRNKPSVYPEVLKLQELLESNGGHRGGWGELEHDAFLQCRRRCIKRHGCDFWLQSMTEILSEKIPGISAEEVVTHEKWYREYSTLKSEQKATIDRWKESRDLTKQQFRHFEAAIQDIKKNVQTIRAKSTPKRQTKNDMSRRASLRSFNSLEMAEVNSSETIEDKPDSPKREPNEIKKNGRHCDTSEREPNQLSTNEQLSDSPEQESTQLPLKKDGRLSEIERPTEVFEDKKRESLQSKESPKDAGSRSYLRPTKLWNLKTQKADMGSRDFRLHIPMANAPKLGIAEWRRCLMGQL